MNSEPLTTFKETAAEDLTAVVHAVQHTIAVVVERMAVVVTSFKVAIERQRL